MKLNIHDDPEALSRRIQALRKLKTMNVKVGLPASAGGRLRFIIAVQEHGRKVIAAGIPPANSPVTVSGGWIYNRVAHKSVYVSGKGKNKPLFDTGALYDAFDYEIEGE